MLSDVIDAFDKSPNSLGVLKRLLNQLVLPLDDGKVANLVDPTIYKDTELIRQLFRLLSPLLNCLSPDLIRYLCKQSNCSLAINAVKEFIRVHDQQAESILCIRKDDESELNDLDTASFSAPGHLKVHSMPLNKLQSLHPLVFRRLDIHKSTSSPQMVRLSVEVNRPMLTLQDYDNISNAVSAVLMLPKLAMVYAGCTVAPLVLTWLVPFEIMKHMESSVTGSTASGDRLLAEQSVVSIAVGENFKHKSLGIQVCH